MIHRILNLVSTSLLLYGGVVFGKELFTPEKFERYLTLKNPYVYSAVGQTYIDEAKIKTAKGVFDTKLSALHEKKNYPLSNADFSDLVLSKPVENGTEFMVGFRKAEGTQEYNNIKTGKEGEVRVGINVPLLSVLHGTNERKYKVDSTLNLFLQSELVSQNNLRNLSARIFTDYYKLLYFNDLIILENELWEKAKKRDLFIRKKVKAGDLSEVSLLESEQQIMNRKQRVLTAKNNYYVVLQSVLKFLDIKEKYFLTQYTLPRLKMSQRRKLTLDMLLTKAVQRRPDIKILEQKRKKLALDNDYNTLSKYPKVNLYAYGVYDMEYGEGTKVGFRLDFPLERRGYEGKKVEIKKGFMQVEEEKKRLLLEVKANLNTLLHALEMMYQNIEIVYKQIKIAEDLEQVETKKYENGLSNLFELNQREIVTLEAKQKKLEIYLNALLIRQEMHRETATHDIFNF